MDTTLYEKLMNAGFRFVSYRPHSEREIKDFLKRTLHRWKTAGSLTEAKVLDRLKDYGHVDDGKFAAWWIEQRGVFRPKGEMAIRMELSKKGIPKSIIDEAFTRLRQGEGKFDELESARKVIQRKIVKIGQLPIIEQKKKLYTFLAQRGFSSGTIAKIIDETTQKDYNTAINDS